jgi:hypothetical protein
METDDIEHFGPPDEETADIEHFGPPDEEAAVDLPGSIAAPPTRNQIGCIPKFRRELIGHRNELRGVLERLLAFEKSEGTREIEPDVAEALACAASDTAYPPFNHSEGERFERALRMSAAGKFNDFASLAIAAVETALKITISALASVDMIDALDERVPFAWHNMHPSEAARRLNRLGHSLARGTIPGWRGGDD